VPATLVPVNEVLQSILHPLGKRLRALARTHDNGLAYVLRHFDGYWDREV
jgi:hypothetical protein